jgi:hypothetical protein
MKIGGEVTDTETGRIGINAGPLKLHQLPQALANQRALLVHLPSRDVARSITPYWAHANYAAMEILYRSARSIFCGNSMEKK